MNKYSLLLISGALLTFSACEVEHEDGVDSQAVIDSMVDARTEEIRMELEMKNDSIINELAMWRADSILAARSGKRVSTSTRPKPRPNTTTTKRVQDVATSTEEKNMDNKPTSSGSKWDQNKDGGTTSGSKWDQGEDKGTTSGSKWDQ